MQTTTVTLKSLIDRTLFELEAATEKGVPLVMSSLNRLESAVDKEFALTAGEMQVSDICEFGAELMLVTGKSAATTPVYTVQRGYYNTTAASSYAGGTVGHANPQFPRRRVADFVDRARTRLEALGIPFVTATQVTRTTGLRQVEVPAGARQVLQLMYVNATSGRILELDNWFEYDNMPSAVSSTGKLLHLPLYVADSDVLTMVYTAPYQWGDPGFPDEAATLEVPSGAEDLPVAYAAALAVGGREISRQQLDRAEEWSQTEPLRGNGGGALVRAKWQDFYRALDEARRVVQLEVPTVRPLVKRPKVRI